MKLNKQPENLVILIILFFALLNSACQETILIEKSSALADKNMVVSEPLQRGDTEAERFRRDMTEIQTLAQIKDLDGLLRLKDQVAEKWKNQANLQILLTSDICKVLNSYDFGNKRQYLLARQCAKHLLSNNDDVPVDLEKDMVGILQEVEEYRLKIVPESNWTTDRLERVKFLFHLWNRVQNNIDRNFDFKDLRNRPLGNVPVPAPNYLPGIRLEDVREPEVRKKYEEAIKVNVAKAKKYNEQMLLHRINERLDNFVEQFLIGMYSQPPFDIDELNKVLQMFKFNSEKKEKILNAVLAIKDRTE